MNSLTHLGTFEGLVQNADESVASIAQTRAMIESLHPDVVEVPRLGEKTEAYGFGAKKMSEAYAFISVHKAHVNLGFFHATRLNDVASLLEGTGAEIRHTKLRTLEDLKQPEILELLKQAKAERQSVLGK